MEKFFVAKKLQNTSRIRQYSAERTIGINVRINEVFFCFIQIALEQKLFFQVNNTT